MPGCGEDGSDGAAGAPGAPGEPGAPGTPGLGIIVSDLHGKAHALQATKGPNNPANLCTTITNASVGADGKLTVDFDVRSSGADQKPCTADDMPYAGLASNMISFVVAQLRPGDAAGDSTYWVSYVNSSRTKAAGVGTTPEGTKMSQPGTISGSTGGTWTDKGNGSYTFVTNQALTAGITIADPPKPGTYAYDANLTHRVAAQMGDYDGATGPATHGANNPVYDFVPATGQKVADPREIVVKENCNECHGTLSVHGSNGQRLDTKLCVTCHNVTGGDPESGNILDLKVMVHKIHMGRYLPSVKFDFVGEGNGLYNLDPEGAVKGTPYAIWGFNNTKHEWSEVAFPANAANCTKCHQNATHADNWKTKPTKEACGACHDGIDFATGTGTRLAYPYSKIDTTSSATGHIGGVQPNSNCTVCHGATGSQTTSDSIPAPVPALHDFAAKTKTDYSVDISMTAPANGTHYVAGEAPVVTLVFKDSVTGLPIDHTALSSGTANLYVYGPRTDKKPVLTTAAASTTASTAGNSLLTTTTDPKVARTAASITYNLNAIAGLQSGTYFVQIQATKVNPNPKTMSLALKTFQVGTATEDKKVAVCTTCHENTMWHDTPNAAVGNHPAPFDPDWCAACHDNKAASNAKLGRLINDSTTKWKGGGVCVDTKGTGATTDDTVDAALIGQNECVATTNRKWMGTVCVVGGNIDATITASAACTAAGGTWTSYSANNQGFGAAPIMRRVHGVHFAQKANGTPGVQYPFEIYNNHNVSIVFPQDVKNCETCHTSETTGTWATKSSRVACLACHDSDATQAHGTVMTVDPTPLADVAGSLPGPFSGDEQESCATCHN